MAEIPEQIQFDGKRIVLFGPESSGKTTLSRKLATYFNTAWVPEFARSYAQRKLDQGWGLTYDDVIPITIGQRIAENLAAQGVQTYLFCDTCILQNAVYSRHYYDAVPNAVEKAIKTSHYDLYLLTTPDIPWEADGIRDRPSNRQEMFETFKAAVKTYNKSYITLSGSENTRFASALKAIKRI
jgi:NadR type nicotinamide-nucleotide adenylyltransferase